MHRALQRQLKRTLGIDDPASLADVLAAIRAEAAAANLSPALQQVISGLGEFVERVDSTYEQFDRDLELRTRSLELSSEELSEANKRLRDDIAARNRAMDSLKKVLAELVGDTGAGVSLIDGASENIEFLSRLIQELVGEREIQRHKLDNLKFALDEHAIVSITDIDGKITYANDKFCSISGYRRDELIGSNHRVVKSHHHSAEFFQVLWATISSGKVWHGEVCNRAKSGDEYWVSATIVPLLDQNGLPQEYIGIRTDITEQKRTEQALALSRDAAEAASRAKSDFLANMSHEIRTPMNGVIGMTDLVLDTELDGEQREYLSVVKSSAQSLLVIINDILDFSKIEAGRLGIESIAFDLRRTLAETLKTLSPRAHEKSLEVISDVDASVPARLLGDPGRLRQILVNLVGNAIKFTAHGSIFVSVRLLRQDAAMAKIHVSVKDTGIGIAEDKQGLIFEAFAQEDTSTTRRYGGTGLGLTICKRLVELMQGEIGVDSKLGEGSDFHFSLTLGVDKSGAGHAPVRASLRGVVCLLVDDNLINQQVLSGMLKRSGMVVHVASSAAEAQAWLAGDTVPDVILTDVHMPVMDGFEFGEWIRQQARLLTTPVIVLSSGAMRGDAQRCRELGLNGYFPKPVEEDELLQAVQELLGHAESVEPDEQKRGLVTRHALRDQSAGLSVLLVEDHPVNQKLAIRLLEKWGHRCVLAHNGEEALALFEQMPFDVCLMDMQMPVMGGLECTRLLRQREIALGTSTPLHIIAMTANAMQGDREACMAAGMNDYLSKPIKPADLQTKLDGIKASDDTNGRVLAFTEDAPAARNNFDFAKQLAAVDSEIMEIIAPVFIEHYPTDLAALSEAVNEHDCAAVHRLAHALKGTLATFGADPACRHAEALEILAKSGSLDGAIDMIGELKDEGACLVAALRDYIALGQQNT